MDQAAVARLLAAMCQHSRSVKPKGLGILGEANLTKQLTRSWHVDQESVRYRKAEGYRDGVPFVWEVAFGIYEKDYHGCGFVNLVGLNWTPALQPPIRELTQLLGQQRVDRHDPVVLIVHLACPVIPYTDRGKSIVDLGKVANDV